MKVFKGGYKIVSLLNIDITSDFTIPGIYDDIKDSHGKPILVSEINVGGEKMNDAYTIVEKSGTSFILKVYGYALTVASTDAVTVAEDVNGVTSIGGVSGEITLGDGLAITEEGELSVSGGGNTLYQHDVKIQTSSDPIITAGMSIINTSPDQINTVAKMIAVVGDNKEKCASGYYYSSSKEGPLFAIYFVSTNAYAKFFNTSTHVVSEASAPNPTLNDSVRQIS